MPPERGLVTSQIPSVDIVTLPTNSAAATWNPTPLHLRDPPVVGASAVREVVPEVTDCLPGGCDVFSRHDRVWKR